jgi:hypothetical protein
MADTTTNAKPIPVADAVAQTEQHLSDAHDKAAMAKVFDEFTKEAKDPGFADALKKNRSNLKLPEELQLEGFELTNFKNFAPKNEPELPMVVVRKESADKDPKKADVRIFDVNGSEYQGTSDDGSNYKFAPIPERQNLLAGAKSNAKPAPETNGQQSDEKKHIQEVTEKVVSDSSSLPVQRGEGYFQVLKRMNPKMSEHELAVAAHHLKKDFNNDKNELKVGERFLLISQADVQKKVEETLKTEVAKKQQEDEAAKKEPPHSDQAQPGKDKKNSDGSTTRFDENGKPVEFDLADNLHSTVVSRDKDGNVNALTDVFGNNYTLQGDKTWVAKTGDGHPIAEPPSGPVSGIEMTEDGKVTISRGAGKATDVIGPDGRIVKSDVNGNPVEIAYNGEQSTKVHRDENGKVDAMTDLFHNSYACKNGKWTALDPNGKPISDTPNGAVSGIDMDKDGVVTINRGPGKARDELTRDGVSMSFSDYDGDPQPQPDGSVVKSKMIDGKNQVVEIDYKDHSKASFVRKVDGSLDTYTSHFGHVYSRDPKDTTGKTWLSDGKVDNDQIQGPISNIEVSDDGKGTVTVSRAGKATDIYTSDGAFQSTDQNGDLIACTTPDKVQIGFDPNGRAIEVISPGAAPIQTDFQYNDGADGAIKTITKTNLTGSDKDRKIEKVSFSDGKYQLKDDDGKVIGSSTNAPAVDAKTGDWTITTDEDPKKSYVFHADGSSVAKDVTPAKPENPTKSPVQPWLTNKELPVLPPGEGTHSTDQSGNDITTWPDPKDASQTITRTSKPDGSGEVIIGDGTRYTFGSEGQRKFIEKWCPAKLDDGEKEIQPAYGIKKYDDGRNGFADGTRVVKTEINGDDDAKEHRGRKGWEIVVSPDGNVHCGSGELDFEHKGRRKHGMDIVHCGNAYVVGTWGPHRLDNRNRTVNNVLDDHAVQDWTTKEHSPLRSVFTLEPQKDGKLKLKVGDDPDF